MKKLRLFSLSALSAITILTSCGGNGNVKSGGGTKSFTSKKFLKTNEQIVLFFSGKEH